MSDEVVKVLKEAGKPLTKEEIIDGVFKKRLVKKATINLALMSKDRFRKENGKYQLVPSN